MIPTLVKFFMENKKQIKLIRKLFYVFCYLYQLRKHRAKNMNV